MNVQFNYHNLILKVTNLAKKSKKMNSIKLKELAEEKLFIEDNFPILAQVCSMSNVRGVLVPLQNEISNERHKYSSRKINPAYLRQHHDYQKIQDSNLSYFLFLLFLQAFATQP